MQTLNNAVRYTESEALDAANGFGNVNMYYGAVNLKEAEFKYPVATINKVRQFYKDLTFQQFDFSDINNEIDESLKQSTYLGIDAGDKYRLINAFIQTPSFKKILISKYNMSEAEAKNFIYDAANQGGNGKDFYQFMNGVLYDNVVLDKNNPFQYTKPLAEVQNIYQDVFSKTLPVQIKTQDPTVSSETTRVLQMYHTNLTEIKKDYNKTIPVYRPLVNKDTSDKFGGNTFKQYKTFIAGQVDNLMSNYGKPNNPNKIKLVRYSEDSGELAKEECDINLINTQLKDAYNASRGKKPGDDGYDDTYDIRKYLADDDNFKTIQFAFDGYNDDPTRPLNAIFTLNLRMNGTDKPVQVELPLSDLPIQLASDMGIPIDKYKLMTPLTKSLQASQGLHFTLPPITGNIQHSGEDLKNGVKY